MYVYHMDPEQLKQTYLSLPVELQKEVSLFVELLVQRHQNQIKQNPFPIADLNLPEFNEKIDLSKYALSEDSLAELKQLWEDEIYAESLCKLLTA